VTWYWYIARSNELLLDLDKPASLYWALVKLRRNIRRGFLKVESVWLYPTLAKGHHHLLVFLRSNLSPIERAVWELYLGSDIKRAEYNIQRILRGLDGADLLIVDRPYPGLEREPDYTCDCPEKHKWRRITNHCPVLRKLHGSQAGAEYFAINRDRCRLRKKLRLRYGCVPISRLLEWPAGPQRRKGR